MRAAKPSGMLSITAHGATVRMHDTGGKVSRCMRNGVPYERALLEHIYQQGFSGLAVDAGANIGNHTLWLALVCGLDVAAFEPLHYELLREHVSANDAQGRVRVERAALGDVESIATHLGRGRLDPSGRSDVADEERPDVASGRWVGSGAQVPVRTLDSYGLTDVAVIKADVEGMEARVFRGGLQTIDRDRPVIFAETWGGKEHREIANVLEPLGYRVTAQFSGRESATPVERWDG